MDEQPLVLAPEALRELLRRLRASGVDEIEVASGSSRLFLKRSAGAQIASDEESWQSDEPARPDGIPVVAPLTGVLYTRPAPDEPPFVSTGATVEMGQVVALIETMKLFNEVTAEVAGEVISIVGQDDNLVEVGQPLLYLRPREASDDV